MYEVLIVEDDPMVAMINKQYVNQNPHFHVCNVCRDGNVALEYLQDNMVHLLILDLYMPRTDGLELLHKIREMQMKVSVIMVTAANDTKSIEEALSLGIVDYLVKPFANERFQQALEAFLRRQNAFHDLNSMNQEHIDALIGGRKDKQAKELPKGIQAQTLEALCNYLSSSGKGELTGDEIAERVGLSRVTIRRYMGYLQEKGLVIGRMNYETGGRPSMLYKWNG